MGADAMSYRVAVGAFDLRHLGTHLVSDSWTAELAVQEAQVVGVGVKDHDCGGVDACRGVQAGEQLARLFLVLVVVVAGGRGHIQWGQTQEHAGVIGQTQAGGYAFDDGEFFDRSVAVNDLVDAGLTEAGGRADADLTGSVFCCKAEKSGDVAFPEHCPGLFPVPDSRG
ncbi:hypothetical protein ITP53_55050 [Nonomuraea sp. K274]|uniref:Uncharacterized protein n=1 Tax=Nonomuraea cypriaca TaxID=1187855 RepID=A0A931F5E3_9ACTN|nr:hypothetical protein [Nonomuraea cypriaca]